MVVRLNRAQAAELSEHLARLAHNEVPFLPVELQIVYGTAKNAWQLKVNGAYLHRDGEWATFPQGQPQKTA